MDGSGGAGVSWVPCKDKRDLLFNLEGHFSIPLLEILLHSCSFLKHAEDRKKSVKQLISSPLKLLQRSNTGNTKISTIHTFVIPRRWIFGNPLIYHLVHTSWLISLHSSKFPIKPASCRSKWAKLITAAPVSSRCSTPILFWAWIR